MAKQEESGLPAEYSQQEESRQKAIAEMAASTTIDLSPEATEISVGLNLRDATRIPLGEIASLGTAFASIPEAFRTIKGTVSIPDNLLTATDAQGNPFDVAKLQSFNDGSGLMGSFRDPSKGFGQARLHEVQSQTLDSIAKMPYDPTALFMAAALMEINKKLDDIQETQLEMFEYLKNKDKAKQRANLETLSDTLNSYQYNWDNQRFVNAKLKQVTDIRKDALEAVKLHRAEIKGKLNKKNLLHIDKDVRDKTAAIRSELEEYRLAVYLYSFSSFLEVMLAQTFDSNYLKSLIEDIDDMSIEYRKLYTDAYNLIEGDADSSVRAIALGGLSGAIGFLGKAIEKTPIGDLTPIDETLQDASKGIGEFSKSVKQGMMRQLTDARSSDVRPFIDNIESVNRLYNDPIMLLADEDAIYVLPMSEDDEEDENDEPYAPETR